jgi:hypothetical protein
MVFAGVFGKSWWLGVVNLWWLRGRVRGEGGQEDGLFLCLISATFWRFIFGA